VKRCCRRSPLERLRTLLTYGAEIAWILNPTQSGARAATQSCAAVVATTASGQETSSAGMAMCERRLQPR
jgi:hypothetical protein